MNYDRIDFSRVISWQVLSPVEQRFHDLPMALFRRNIVGTEVLLIWRYVSQNGPVPREELIQRYYPGDAADPDDSDQVKPLTDAIEFLGETNQLREEKDGLVITDAAREEVNPKISLLHGIRTTTGKDNAYNDVLDVLTEDDVIFFDRQDPLVDLLSDRRSDDSWNTTRLNYWRRMMEAIGVVRDIDTGQGGEFTSMLCISPQILDQLLQSVMDTSESAQLRRVLDDIHEQYLPVYAGANRNQVATYFERALLHAQKNNLVNIKQESDFGPSVTLSDASLNSIALRVHD